jgi:hypothetical protein
MVTIAVALPPEFVAVTVYEVDEVMAVGVPEIAPVEIEKTRPAGSVGVIDQDVTVPPVAVGVAVDMSVSFDNVNEFGV